MQKKNLILSTVAGVGMLLSIIGGVAGGADAAIVLVILTVSVLAGIFFFYQNPKGEVCTPKKEEDSNVATWVTNELGMCVPSTCEAGYFIVKDKCVIPTNAPKGWDVSGTANSFTSNTISSSNADSSSICAYTCYDTDGCNIATYSSSTKMCTLHTEDDSVTTKGTVMDATLIKRPVKK